MSFGVRRIGELASGHYDRARASSSVPVALWVARVTRAKTLRCLFRHVTRARYEFGMEIELVRGTRRRKHVEAVLTGDRLRVSFPRWMSLAEAQQTADELAERMRRRVDPALIDIAARTRKLARQYGLPRPKTVRWVDNMRQRWGSCTPDDGAVRISSRLAAYPAWVLDYVLVHELAHLLVASHGPAHDALVDRYPYAERARGYLIAMDLDPNEGDRDASPLSVGDVRP
jgi:predicted metal-dependent hydrolase